MKFYLFKLITDGVLLSNPVVEEALKQWNNIELRPYFEMRVSLLII